MTLLDIQEMLEDQDYECGVCRKAIDLTTKRVDHCHSTGYVRGLLCWNCNTALGKLGDTEEGVQRALSYLQRNPSSFKAQPIV